MAKTTLSGTEFISSIFKPNVLVITSTDAELLCIKNHLTFNDLLKPFSTVNKDVLLRDQNNISHHIKNLSVNFVDINSLSLPNHEIKKLFNDIVSKSCQNFVGNVIPINYGGIELSVPVNTPWFEAWRKIFLDNLTQSDHEFLSHYLAAVLVVSTFNNDIVDQFQRLSHQLSTHQQNNSSKFFNTNILKYYVLLHDQGQGDKSKADELYKQLRSNYGPNCFLLSINSASTLSPTEHGMNNINLESVPDPWIHYLIPGGNIVPDVISNEKKTNNDINLKENIVQTTYFDDPLSLLKSSFEDSSSTHSTKNTVKNSTSYPQLTSITNNSFHFFSSDNSGFNDGNDIVKIKSDINKPHGQCLSTADLEKIREFIYEFISFSLIPWVENTLKQLNEQIAYKMKMSRGIFNVTRKFFGGGSSSSNKTSTLNSSLSGSANNLSNSASTRVVYTSEAIEMQMRRHADLAFLFQQYELAYQTYNVLKKEFHDDSAWLHYAGTMEMSALSIFLQGSSSQRQYPFHFMESAINIYLTQNKNIDYATRAALLNCEALKSQGLYLQASNQFIKLTTELFDMFGNNKNMSNLVKENDLRSALLLEQSAHFYLYTKTPMIRKYVFHLILAGHRFGKAGQKRHTIRCYTQALPIFKGKNWTLAEDHIYATISRHAYNQKQLEISLDALKPLLSKHLRQSASLQATHLREFLKIFREYIEINAGPKKELVFNKLPEFPLPIFDVNTIKIMLGQPIKNFEEARDMEFSDTDINDLEWRDLEGNIIEYINPNINIHNRHNFARPTCLSKNTNNTVESVSVVGEHITIQIYLENPLHIPIVLTDLYILWRFSQPHSSESENVFNESNSISIISNEIESEAIYQTQEYVVSEILADICLLPKEKKMIELSIIPKVLGEIKITGLSFNLNSTSLNQISNNYNQSYDSGNELDLLDLPVIKLRGKIDFTNSILDVNEDKRLHFIIINSMPKLKVVFSDFPKTLIYDEVCKVNLTLTNNGKECMKNIYLSVSPSYFFTFGNDEFTNSVNDSIYQYFPIKNSHNEFQENIISEKSFHKKCQPISTGIDNVLAPGNSISFPIWIRFQKRNNVSDIEEDKRCIKFLFYYEPVTKHKLLKYRLLRHKSDIDLKPTIQLQSQLMPCKGLDNKSYIANIKIENQNHPSDTRVTDFEINQITIISKFWKVNQEFCSINSMKVIQVGPKETHSIFLKLDQICGSSSNSRIFSNVYLTNSIERFVQSHSSPCLDFFNLNYSYNKHAGNINSYEISNIITENISFIILWKATCKYSNDYQSVHCGQSHIFLNSVESSQVFTNNLIAKRGKNRSSFLLRESNNSTLDKDVNLQPFLKYSKLINICQKFNQNIIHDFQKSKKLIVSVTVSLFNTSSEDLIIRLEPIDPPEMSSTKLNPLSNNVDSNHTDNSAGCSNILWIGLTNRQILMSSYQSIDVQLLALVTRPGVYEMQSLIVKAAVIFNKLDKSQSMDQLTFIKQDNLFSSLLIVSQLNPTLSFKQKNDTSKISLYN